MWPKSGTRHWYSLFKEKILSISQHLIEVIESKTKSMLHILPLFNWYQVNI